tara:strand:- start:173 stop:940 length:768 start_codon:yes stop_codon:yes gene_type:complete
MIENKKVFEDTPELRADLELLFSDLKQGDEYTDYELPSGGNLYADKKSMIKVRPLNFSDEKALAGNTDSTMDMLLSRCVKGVDVGNLLPIDKSGIFLKLRQISYGDEYNVELACPDCERKSSITIPISSFPVNKLPSDISEPYEVYLGEIKRNIFIRFARTRDESYTEDLDKFHTNLWRFIEKIQIKDDRYASDKTLVAKVVEKLPRKDMHTLINKLMLNDYGIDSKFIFNCPKCKNGNLVEAPFGPDFFTENSN